MRSFTVLKARALASTFLKAIRSQTRCGDHARSSLISLVSLSLARARASPHCGHVFQVLFNPWSDSRRGDKVFGLKHRIHSLLSH